MSTTNNSTNSASLFSILSAISNLEPMKSPIYVAEYSFSYGGIKIDKVAISTHSKMSEICQVIKDEDYCDKDTIVMFKDQYETIFVPLFKLISDTNVKIRELKEISESEVEKGVEK
jgi:hypothetical protein